MMNEVMELQVQGVNKNEENKKKQKMEYVIEGNVAKFTTSSGVDFFVDSEDAEMVSQYRWHVGKGYVNTRINGKLVKLHRLIMNLLDSEDKTLVVDHADRNPLNNCKCNLRVCTHKENNRNTNAKGYSRRSDGRFDVYIMVDGKSIYLGRYTTEEQARAVRIMAEKDYFGEYSSKVDLFEDSEILRLYEEAMASIEHLHKNEVRLNDEDDVVYVTVTSKGISKEFVMDLDHYEMIKSYKWCVNNKGQIVTNVNGEKTLLARFLLGLPKGDRTKRVTFIDGNKLNFRRENLQVVECKTKKK